MSIEILLVRVQNVCVFVCIHLSIESFIDWLFWRLTNIQSILYDFEDCFNNWFLVKDKTAAINAVFSHSSKWQLAQTIIKHAFSHFNLTICYNWPELNALKRYRLVKFQRNLASEHIVIVRKHQNNYNVLFGIDDVDVNVIASFSAFTF